MTWFLDNWFSLGLILLLVGYVTRLGPCRAVVSDTKHCFFVGVVWWIWLIGVLILLLLWILWPVNAYMMMKECRR